MLSSSGYRRLEAKFKDICANTFRYVGNLHDENKSGGLESLDVIAN